MRKWVTKATRISVTNHPSYQNYLYEVCLKTYNKVFSVAAQLFFINMQLSSLLTCYLKYFFNIFVFESRSFFFSFKHTSKTRAL